VWRYWWLRETKSHHFHWPWKQIIIIIKTVDGQKFHQIIVRYFTYLNVCFVWISVFRALCPLLIVSLNCPFLIDPSVFSNVYLQCLWIVHSWLLIRFSLTFINKDQLYCLSLPLVQ
jgi:hypothetical protein